MGTIHDLAYAVWWIHAHQAQFVKIWIDLLEVLGSVYMILSLFVRACPNLPIDHFLLPIIKWLGKLTQRTVDDNALRAQTEQKKKGTQPTP